MTAHAHRWERADAPDYRCSAPLPDGSPCLAVGRRGKFGGRIKVVAADAWEAELLSVPYERAARAEIKESEGYRPRRAGDWTPDLLEHLAGAREGDAVAKTHRHQWTEADEDALRDAVMVVFRSELPKSVERRLAGWSAVAGRLLPDLTVTPDACRTRWQVLLDREREEERARAAAREAAELARQEAEEEQEAADVEAYATPPDGAEASWDALAQRIATMELEAADDLAAALHGLRAEVGALADRVPGAGWVEGLQGRLDRIEATLAALAAAWEVTT